MTAGSSHSSGTTTLTVSPSGIAVGDYVVKQHLTVSSSVVSATANESFSTMSYDTAPNGAQLIGSRSYPNPNNVYAHWWLGGPSESLALKDQTGNNRGLTKLVSVNLGDTFKAGKYSASNFAAANYLRTATNTVASYDGNGELIQYSFWVYFDASNGSDRTYIGAYDGTAGGSGILVRTSGSASTVSLAHVDGGSVANNTHPTTMSNGSWNHIVIQSQSSVTQNVYLNGVLNSVSANAISATTGTQALYLGGLNGNTGTLDPGTLGSPMSAALKMADMIVWRGGSLLTQSDVNYLYNAGVPQFIGYNPAVLRNEYAVTGQSGQRISMKAKLNRSTTAVSPYILNAGMIKTG
jgi:hypothetical protein